MNRTSVTTVGLGLGVAAVVAVTAAPAAQAVPYGPHTPGSYYAVADCPGKPIKAYPLGNDDRGTQRGLTQIFYSPVNGGTVCAKTLDSAAGRHLMSVKLTRDNSSFGKTYGSDKGRYTTYAGGIAIGNSRNRCFSVNGTVTYGPKKQNHYNRTVSLCKAYRYYY